MSKVIVNVENTKKEFDVLRTNRFIVHFPEKYKTPEWTIKSVSFDYNNQMEIKLRHFINYISIDKFDKMPQIGDVKIELLDQCGCIILIMNLSNVEINKIIPCDLNYTIDKDFEIILLCNYEKISYEVINN